MTYYINPIWFYLIELSESLKVLFLVISTCLGVFALAGILICISVEAEYCYTLDAEQHKNKAVWLKRFKMATILCIIFAVLCTITPSEKTATKMMIASVVTYENVDKVKGDAKEIIDYITEKAIEIKGEDKKEE